MSTKRTRGLQNPLACVVEHAPLTVDSFHGNECRATILLELQRLSYRKSQRIDTALKLGKIAVVRVHGPYAWMHRCVRDLQRNH